MHRRITIDPVGSLFAHSDIFAQGVDHLEKCLCSLLDPTNGMQRFAQLSSNRESESVELPSKYLSNGISSHYNETTIAYERDGIEVRTRLRQRWKMYTLEQFYRPFVVTFLHEPVSEKNEHLRLCRTLVIHRHRRITSQACLDSVENQLIIRRINEVVHALHCIIPLPNLKQDNGLDKPSG